MVTIALVTGSMGVAGTVKLIAHAILTTCTSAAAKGALNVCRSGGSGADCGTLILIASTRNSAHRAVDDRGAERSGPAPTVETFVIEPAHGRAGGLAESVFGDAVATSGRGAADGRE